jgi:hypothetical protein
MATKLPVIAEKDVQKACIDLLNAERIWFMRLNTGAMKTENSFVRFNKPGTPDILAVPQLSFTDFGNLGDTPRDVLRPVLVWLEIKKSKGGKQSDAQKQFQAEVQAQGHTYLLISDVDQLRDWLKANR